MSAHDDYARVTETIQMQNQNNEKVRNAAINSPFQGKTYGILAWFYTGPYNLKIWEKILYTAKTKKEIATRLNEYITDFILEGKLPSKETKDLCINKLTIYQVEDVNPRLINKNLIQTMDLKYFNIYFRRNTQLFLSYGKSKSFLWKIVNKSPVFKEFLEFVKSDEYKRINSFNKKELKAFLKANNISLVWHSSFKYMKKIARSYLIKNHINHFLDFSTLEQTDEELKNF